MSSKRKNNGEELPSEIDFESALQKIELMIQSMEDEQLPLDQLVNHYESASKLIKQCEILLSSARERVELITLSSNQELSAQPSHLPAPNDDNDNTLF